MTVNNVCPECKTGKHQNCNGVADMTDDNFEVLCRCARLAHTDLTTPFQPMLSIFPEDPSFSEPPPPPNDPGIRADSFPELIDDERSFVRLDPGVSYKDVIKDLYDVEVQNPNGEWVPMVPYSLNVFMGVHKCLCGALRFGSKRYQEHYAYAHILGMED